MALMSMWPGPQPGMFATVCCFMRRGTDGRILIAFGRCKPSRTSGLFVAQALPRTQVACMTPHSNPLAHQYRMA
jgi:hypothetical protein